MEPRRSRCLRPIACAGTVRTFPSEPRRRRPLLRNAQRRAPFHASEGSLRIHRRRKRTSRSLRDVASPSVSTSWTCRAREGHRGNADDRRSIRELSKMRTDTWTFRIASLGSSRRRDGASRIEVETEERRHAKRGARQRRTSRNGCVEECVDASYKNVDGRL